MNQSQQETVLKSIALSSSMAPVAQQDRQTAFQVLEEFKAFEGRIPVCIQWLHQERHVLEGLGDATVAVKLYASTIIQNFLEKGYASLVENDRLALRHAVLTAARQLAPRAITDENRILGNKLALLLDGLVVRDFPQRWPTFFTDVFSPVPAGGLWYDDAMENKHIMGVLVCLECLRLVTEDCTDSDFNAKISTTRRNDVLTGLHELSSTLRPLLFAVLEQYAVLVQSKATLQSMKSYLTSSGRTLVQMTPEENAMYQTEVQRTSSAARVVSDCLATLERFCFSMPPEWMLSGQQDFTAALLHLLREPTASIQVQAVACLEQLALRKLDQSAWMRLIKSLPQAVGEAIQAAQAELGRDAWTAELGFHRALSRMLAQLISANISHITTDKQVLKAKGDKFQAVFAYFRLMVDMIHHPSGRICGEQVNTWIALFRDPQIAKTDKLLEPFVSELLSSYLDHLTRIRWEDVEEQTHPNAGILEASWNDEEEYDQWFAEFRSKASQLFRLLAQVEPEASVSVISSRVQTMLSRHGNGEPRDHLHPTNSQLTQKSEACIQLEALYHPLDNILIGTPSWVFADERKKRTDGYQKREEVRKKVQNSLSQMASALVSWNPSYVWLKFRKAQLLEPLKRYWQYDSSTLPQAVQCLLEYLSAPDEWKPGGSTNSEGLSGEIVGLRKKSGVSLVSISKYVPQHLVPWLSELSEAARGLLSSNVLQPSSQMHLYEFLSCVATAVENPLSRASFVADVLSNALKILESPEVKQAISSVEGFMQFTGIAQAAVNPSSVTDPENVKTATNRFVEVYSSVNQLLSVGKRCSEAARKQRRGLIPHVSIDAVGTKASFPDEGPIGLQDLGMHDPFAPLWPRILPPILQILDVLLRLWHPELQAVLLQNPIQRYAYAISDDEAYLSQKHDTKSGGVFGEGGTAGSVVSGVDRRATNLAPRWSGWFNELRNSCFQMLGLLAGSRALFSPEVSQIFPQLVGVVANVEHLQAMEHRHFTQYLKQFVEILMLACPSTLYNSHLAPIAVPLFEHVRIRLEGSWAHIINPNTTVSNPDAGKALTTENCNTAAALASRGGEEWYLSYYTRSGVFVGELDAVTAESVVEKYRIDMTRTFCDLMQTALALKGDWALVLANLAKEDQAGKRNGPSKVDASPNTHARNDSSSERLNADGTPRDENDEANDARKLLRINGLCHFLFLENENVAGNLTLSIVHCLEYPDAYTSRRCTKICHRILETVAWSTRYTPLLADQMFLAAVKNIVTEPKWMVGVEWDMISVIRDIFCRLVLGQTLQPGGQGLATQQPKDPNNPMLFEQAKTAEEPLQGGGILVEPSNAPRSILSRLPGVGLEAVDQLEKDMHRGRSAKAQKDVLRDLLRIAADNSHFLDSSRGSGLLDRALREESLLNQKVGSIVPDLPEKLVKNKETRKAHETEEDPGLASYGIF